MHTNEIPLTSEDKAILARFINRATMPYLNDKTRYNRVVESLNRNLFAAHYRDCQIIDMYTEQSGDYWEN